MSLNLGRSLACCGLLASLAIVGCSSAKPAAKQSNVSRPIQAEVPKWKQLIGHPAPDIDLRGAVPGASRLSDLRGKTVVLVFHLAACEPSRKAMVNLAKLGNTTPAGPFQLIVINIADSEAKSREEMQALGLSVPVVVDNSGSTMEKYRVDAVPLTVVIGPSGKVTYTTLGFGEETARDMLAERIEEAMPM